MNEFDDIEAGTDIDTHIAVVGMACRLPGADTPEQYWENLVAGVDSVRPIPAEERAAWGENPEYAADPRHVAMHGMIDGVGDFDAEFFGYTTRDAAVLNPQHQIFLECAWEALERAGYHPGGVPGTVGVYAGAGRNGYGRIVLERPDLLPGVDVMAATIANEPEHLCTQVSYRLGLTGPSITVQTACSSSLVAIHEASRALLAGDCDMALAGGITIRLPRVGYRYQEGGTLSPDGHCRTFSADAKGIVAGDGAGVVVLRRLQDALDDGDTVHAVLIGSAVNNDGRERAGYTAPGMRGQTEVIRLAHSVAGIEPESIGYVEAHGTGTPVGDPIEVSALTKAFAAGDVQPGSILLGAAKTNIGHTDTAAGVAGLMKAAMALENRVVPGSLNFKEPNPRIDFASSPFTVPTASVEWAARGEEPRRAGVSSFGIGGTNAHAILQEAPERAAEPDSWPAHILPLSARTPAALDAMAVRLAAHLLQYPEQPIADVAHTLQTGRQEFAYRRFVVCTDHESAYSALGAKSSSVPAGSGAAESVVFRVAEADADSVIDELAEIFPVFKAAANDCAGGPQVAVQYALAQLMQDWGVRTGSDSADALVVDLPATEPGGAVVALLDAAGRLWQAGVEVDWSAVARGTRRRRVPLPTYPFERKHFAIRPDPATVAASSDASADNPTPQESNQGLGVTEQLVVLFGQVLGEADETSDFFALGGDSMAAVQLIGLIEEAFGVTPPVDAVFDAPSVPELTAVIEGLLAEEGS